MPGTQRDKPALKEKVVQYYELIVQEDNPVKSNSNFWNEFFLLRANVESLEERVAAIRNTSINSVKENINELFLKCICTLEADRSIRTVNAVQTLCGLVRGAFSKAQGNYGFEIIDFLIGFDQAEAVMQRLIESIHNILISKANTVASLKNICLRFLLTLVTVTDNISQNTVLEYLMMNNIFEVLMAILEDSSLRVHHGNDAVILLMLLVQYRKYESTNPYIVNVSILDNDVVLNGISQIIAVCLLSYNKQYSKRLTQARATGFMSSFTNMVGSMFAGDEQEKIVLKPDMSILLGLYEAVHLNRNFISALTTSHTAPLSPVSSQGDLQSSESVPAVLGANQVELSDVNDLEQPTNLLATFLEYSSIVCQDVKTPETYNIAKLCFIILNCIAEDQYANSLMHDVNMNFSVPLHRLPMRHRKVLPSVVTPARPLAVTAIDLQVEFLLSHMMKTMPAELYSLSLGVIHRLLCYQKRCQVRLNYPWKQLWTALINLLKFLLSNEMVLLKSSNIFHLAQQVVGIFNMFITYGDMFLPSASSYDELYYEIIRTHLVFNNLYSMALRHSTTSGTFQDDATKLVHQLGNIRGVVNHFNPKVESWAAVNHLSSLTEEQVLDVVRSNYETLTLKIHDNLDQYDRYSEKPKESTYFTNLVRAVVLDTRQKAIITKLEQTSLLRDFSLLHR